MKGKMNNQLVIDFAKFCRDNPERSLVDLKRMFIWRAMAQKIRPSDSEFKMAIKLATQALRANK